MAYHLRVTWPFCTRFMLKPTVGIELFRMSTESVGHMTDKTAKQKNLLYRELSTLKSPCQCDVTGTHVETYR